jgi:hypothetical protein
MKQQKCKMEISGIKTETIAGRGKNTVRAKNYEKEDGGRKKTSAWTVILKEALFNLLVPQFYI